MEIKFLLSTIIVERTSKCWMIMVEGYFLEMNSILLETVRMDVIKRK